MGAALQAFFTTPQLSLQDKAQNALALGTSPVVRAVIDPEGGMADVRKLDGISFKEWFMSHGALPTQLAASQARQGAASQLLLAQ